MSNPRSTSSAWTISVAIPVKDEVERIAACLEALSAQRGTAGRTLPPYSVLLFVNNSDDGTAELARSLAPKLGFPLNVVVAALPPGEASAGGARRAAMALAAEQLEREEGIGVLMTTDADSRVPSDWIAKTIAALEAGVDAVAGTVALDPLEEAALPAALKARGALEGCYEALVCEMEARLHPASHDPWPRHPSESGASFALTLASFKAVGGVPNKPLGEDRALASALRDAGFRIRHAPDLVVTTSGRLVGRASGGCADTMRLRIDMPSVHCDEYLRPVMDVLRGAGRSATLLAPEALPRQIRLARIVLRALRARDVLAARVSLAGRALAHRFSSAGSEQASALRPPQTGGGLS